MRRDARERREALIQAAAECFGRFGYGVALEDIADRAGVGRGTLYRNFKDRMALTLAIFARAVDEIGASLDPALSLEQAITNMVLKGAKASALFSRLAFEMPLDADNRAAFELLKSRLVELVQPFVDEAHADGRLRPGVTAEQIVLSMRMISGLLLPNLCEEDVRAQIAEALDLILEGLRPR